MIEKRFIANEKKKSLGELSQDEVNLILRLEGIAKLREFIQRHIPQK